jgi:hypothetical protein
MDTINRSVVIVRPRQAAIDWANTVFSFADAGITVDLETEDPVVYLVPEIDDENDWQQILDEYWEMLFESSLSAYWTGSEAWPDDRSKDMFLRWFEVRHHDYLVDCCEMPLVRTPDPGMR